MPKLDPQQERHLSHARRLRGRCADHRSRHAGDAERHALDALNTDATPLRFLDFLLRETVEAAVLHGDGVLVACPRRRVMRCTS
ncbi:GSU2403 family nucleotidyltransferase fold protein [Caulobacter segnis]